MHFYKVWPFGNDVQPATADQLRHIPVLRFEGSNSVERYMTDTRSLLRQGYDKYLRQGIPFQIRHPVGELGSEVILPTKYLEEVKKAPTNLFSFEAYSEKSFLLNYSRAPRQTEAAAHVIRVDLNRNLGALVPSLWKESASHLNENISHEWRKVPAYELVCSFVARVASVALVGAPLCRNPSWQRIVVETTFVSFGAAQAIKDKYTPRWRWLAPWSESIQKDLRRIRKESIELLRPLYKERAEADSSKDYVQDPSEMFRDVVYWLMKSSQKDRSLYGITESELFLSLTAIHTTSMTLNSLVYDWIAHPEYHEAILCEVNETLAKVRDNNGQWTLQHVAMMRKLDSFMKESARINPIGFVSTQRYTLKPYTFKDGLHIPAGTTIMFPSDGAHYDADNYPEPESFDGLRFLRLRETVDPNRFHYASVSDSALGFGAGIHACPGRFLSAVLMKFFLVHFMTQYEFKYEHGGTERLPNIYNDNTSRPNPSVNLLVRKREQALGE
ncbi:cytochrome P450 [Colletotrichum falcatum]|nr:cytochrome P450 [Colletotrichum falcatum]